MGSVLVVDLEGNSPAYLDKVVQRVGFVLVEVVGLEGNSPAYLNKVVQRVGSVLVVGLEGNSPAYLDKVVQGVGFVLVEVVGLEGHPDAGAVDGRVQPSEFFLNFVDFYLIFKTESLLGRK